MTLPEFKHNVGDIVHGSVLVEGATVRFWRSQDGRDLSADIQVGDWFVQFCARCWTWD